MWTLRVFLASRFQIGLSSSIQIATPNYASKNHVILLLTRPKTPYNRPLSHGYRFFTVNYTTLVKAPASISFPCHYKLN